MNWFYIIALVVIVISTVIGARRGFLRTILSVVICVAMMAFVAWASPYMVTALTENTQIDERIEASVEQRLKNIVQESVADGEDQGVAVDSTLMQKLGISLPQSVLDKILDNGQLADTILTDTGAYTAVASRVTNLAVRGISYIIVLIAVWIIYRIIWLALRVVDRLPVIGTVNRFLGGIFGLLRGILIVGIVLAFPTLA